MIIQTAPANTLPSPPERYEASYFSRTLNALNRAISGAISKDTAAGSLLLQSPNGSVYKLTVDDSGNLTTTAVPLGQQGTPPY